MNNLKKQNIVRTLEVKEERKLINHIQELQSHSVNTVFHQLSLQFYFLDGSMKRC